MSRLTRQQREDRIVLAALLLGITAAFSSAILLVAALTGVW